MSKIIFVPDKRATNEKNNFSRTKIPVLKSMTAASAFTIRLRRVEIGKNEYRNRLSDVNHIKVNKIDLSRGFRTNITYNGNVYTQMKYFILDIRD